MSNHTNSFEQSLLAEAQTSSKGVPVNFKRILDRAIRYWYVIVLCLGSALTLAFLYNRYTTKVYSVSASIIVREGTENAGAEFLYKSNPLINPYRNYYNELYIMRSYPLLQQVVDQLNFGVTWHREGNVKSFEIYEPDFPVALYVIKGNQMPYGRKMTFEFTGLDQFSLAYLSDDDVEGKKFSGLRYNDTITVNGLGF